MHVQPLSRLCGSDVHVWVIKLEAADHRAAELLSVLSREEKRRAVAFKSHDLTTAYVLSRGILRTLLSRYLGISPEDVQFCYTRNGKPLLLSSKGSFHFNVSHSGDLALYAFAGGCELGIDIEQIVDIPDFGMIANRLFSCEETAELQALDMPLRLLVFCLSDAKRGVYQSYRRRTLRRARELPGYAPTKCTGRAGTYQRRCLGGEVVVDAQPVPSSRIRGGFSFPRPAVLADLSSAYRGTGSRTKRFFSR